MSTPLPEIQLVVDLSAIVGSGHFWRMARLGTALEQEGHIVSIVLPDNERARQVVAQFNERNQNSIKFSYLDMPHKIEGFNSRSPFAPLPHDILDPLLLDGTPKVTVIDHYRITPKTMRHLMNAGHDVVLIDDFKNKRKENLRKGDAALVLNPSLPSSALSYGRLKSIATPDYHLLPKDFFEENTVPKTEPNTVFVAFGGTDNGRYGLRLVESMIDQYPTLARGDLTFEIIVPNALYNTAPLQEKLGDRLRIRQSYDALSTLRRVGIGLFSGGQALLEAQAARTRIVGVGVLNHSQVKLGAKVKKDGIVVKNLNADLDKELKRQLKLMAKAVGQVLLDPSKIVRLEPQNPDGLARVVSVISAMARQSKYMPA